MVDTEVYKLAEGFIEDSAVELNKPNIMRLAQHIQDAVEAWFEEHEPIGAL